MYANYLFEAECPNIAIPSTSPAANVSPRSAAPTRGLNLVDTLDVFAHAVEEQLGLVDGVPSSNWSTAFYLGDGLQRAITDEMFDLLNPQAWSPANVWKRTFGAVKQAIELSTLLNQEQARLAWEELKNKLESFVLVKNLSSILKLPAGQFIPLPELVRRAYTVSPFAALWAVEGVGHYYTQLYLEQKGIPHGLLSEAQAQVPVPPESLMMLNAGLGLAFASRLLDTIPVDAPSVNEVRDVLQQFVSLCRDNVRPGYLGAAIEALGLVTRDFYPDLLNIVHQQLVQTAPELVGYFWHGVGRALYFSREYFLPVFATAWSGIETEVQNCADRESAMAGLSWAVTVVNMRQPEIMANVLRSQTDRSPLAHAFINGVVSSTVMRQDTTPNAPLIAAFYQYQPADRQMAATWQARITEPCARGLQEYYPVLRDHNALGEVFRYQDLGSLVSRLQQGRINKSMESQSLH